MNKCEIHDKELVKSPVNGQLFCLDCEVGL